MMRPRFKVSVDLPYPLPVEVAESVLKAQADHRSAVLLADTMEQSTAVSSQGYPVWTYSMDAAVINDSHRMILR
jgi:hypothetical protein